MRRTFALVNAVIAISTGLLVLIGYFIPGLGAIRDILLQWAAILAAFALLVGITNLLMVHGKKMGGGGAASAYSAITIIAFLITVIVVGIDKPTGDWSRLIFNSITVPVENSLLAILAISLIYAVIRLFRRKLDIYTVLFVVTIFIVLLGATPIYGVGEIPVLTTLRGWITNIFALAGARGILLGVALGIVATGLRVLMGADRPYGG